MKRTSILASLAAVVCVMGTMAAGLPAPRNGQGAVQKACPSREALTALLGAASVSMRGGQYAQAEQALRPLAGLHCDPRISLLLAAAEEAGGHAEEAELTLQQAHKSWPDNASIATSLAREYLDRKQTEKALQALAHLRMTQKMPQQEMEMAALVYMANHQLVLAQTAAEMAYKTYPSLHTLLLFANTLQLQGRYPDAKRLLDGQRESYGNAPEFLITAAESEYDASIYPEARTDIERAVALDAGSYQAHYILANVLVKMSEVDRAIEEYHTAIRLAPEQPRTYYQLALVLRNRQDVAGEERALTQTLEADADYAPAHCELGRILLEENRVSEAIPHLNRAIAVNSRLEQAYYLLVRAYAKSGEKDKSQEVVQRLQAVRKSNRPNMSGLDVEPPRQ